MYTFDELSNRINQIIRNLDIPETPKKLYDPIRYILSLGGKRIRPVLTLMSANLFTDNIEDALAPAVSIELFHNFTLIHDDIMDNASLRRNRPSVHTNWNINTGILSGDALSIYAYRYLLRSSENKLPRLLQIFNETALQVCEGQQLDMNYETVPEISENDYIRMIGLKTAVLLSGAMKIGALIADAPDNDITHVYECGKYLGLAFQIRDDYLDTYGDTRTFGKAIGGDILSNKKTFLLVYTLRHLPEKIKKEMLIEMKKPAFDTETKIKNIKKYYDFLNIRKIAKEKIYAFFIRSMDELNHIRVDPERKKIIEDLANKLVSRTK